MQDRATQAQIESLIKDILSIDVCPESQLVLIKIISSSEGLSKSVRICISPTSPMEIPPAVYGYMQMLERLNDKVRELNMAGQFRWSFDRGLYCFWYDHDEQTNYHEVEMEVGDIHGEDRRLSIGINPRVRTDANRINLAFSGNGGEPISCSPLEAIVLLQWLHRLMPEMSITTTAKIVDGTKIIDFFLCLIRSTEEKKRLKDRA